MNELVANTLGANPLALVRHIVLVLVVVLVLERFVVSYLGLELFLRALSELHPASAGLEMLSGRFL